MSGTTHQPNGCAIRDALLPLLMASQTCVRAIPEFWIPSGNRRADLVMVGARLEAYEIKARQDTLRRLPEQVSAYDRIFDRSTAVVDRRHLVSTLSVVPAWWGIVAVSGTDFELVRSSEDNPSVDPTTLVQLLWRNEIVRVMANRGLAASDESRSRLCATLMTLLSPTEIRSVVRDAIAVRAAASRRFGAPGLRAVFERQLAAAAPS